jgi:hypothetical protein
MGIDKGDETMAYNCGNQWRWEAKTPTRYPGEHKAQELEMMRRRAGEDLYKILLEQKLPAVVDIEEKSETRLDTFTYAGGLDVFTITATITPVEHRHVTMAHHYPQYMLTLPRPEPTWIERAAQWIEKLTRR